MKIPAVSIGVRLSLWYVLIFALAQGAFGFGMYVVIRHHLRSIVDDSLRDEMEDLRNVLRGQKPNLNISRLGEGVTETYAHDHAGEYLQILTPQGEIIYLSDFLAKHPLPPDPKQPQARLTFKDRLMDGKRFRFIETAIEAHGAMFLVQLGTPTGEIYATLDTFRHYLLVLAPLVLLAASIGGNWLSHHALAPVDALTRTARTINVTNLSRRLETAATGDELQRLSETLNEMLARIEFSVRRITEFTADASHELRTPVALIRAEAEVALGRERTSQEYRSALQHVLGEAERMSQMLEQLLALVRADAGSETLRMMEVDLAEIGRQAAQSWRTVAESQGFRLTSVIPPGPVAAIGNDLALRRVLDILFDNGLKYSTAPAEVTLIVELENEQVLLRVRDQGQGLEPEEHAKIFERFYRVDKARSRQVGGAGLGLSIALWIAKQHHGSITVTSEKGVGAEFCVSIPSI